MLRSWRGALRATARVSFAPRAQLQRHVVATALPHRTVQFRKLSVQIQSQTVSIPLVHDAPHHALAPSSLDADANATILRDEHVLSSSKSSYADALAAFQSLRTHAPPLQERHYLRLIEKASAEHHHAAVRTHFTDFCNALKAHQIALRRRSKATWAASTTERLQIHRHVLWTILQSGSVHTRSRVMQRHYRRHELATKRNRLELYESDSLNFLLRMECTFKFVHGGDGGAPASWLTRVSTILDEMRRLQFRTSYSSSHALLHFLMHRPDVAVRELSDEMTTAADETLGDDQAINRVLNALFNEYPGPLERDARRLSLAVSTAASARRLWLAVQLLRDADSRGIAVDAASFAHVVAMAKDEDTRLAIADLYMRAKEHDRIYDSEDNQSMKKYLLLYAVLDGNFTQIMELLHEMEYNKIPAPPRTVALLFSSIGKYRAKIRRMHRKSTKAELDAALQQCPSILQLMNNFPSVIDRSTHTGSSAILHALRSGDIEVALTVLRTTVQHTKVPINPEVFAQVLYAVLVTDASKDILVAHEVEQLYETRYRGKRDLLNAQLLNLCESNHDLETMVAVLNSWHDKATQPLSKRALQRVFDVISTHLKAIREQEKQHEDDDDELTGNVRYKIGSLELSLRGVLEKYPMLVPLNSSTLNNALMRSATAQLVDDVATLLTVAHTKQFDVEPVVYKAALDVLSKTSEADPNSPVRLALVDCIGAMKANGSWSTLTERFPEFVSKFDD